MLKMVSIFVSFILTISLFAQYPNIKVNDPTALSPEEVSIAINPTNPDNLAMGANIRYIFTSIDGGLTWTTNTMSSSLGVWGDPVLHFDKYGNLYYGHLSNPQSGNWLDRIVVQKSQNGGFSWNNGVGVGLNQMRDQDKEWIISDMTDSPFEGNVYMSWTEFDKYGSTNPMDSTRIRFSRSLDHGETWSNAITISDVGGNCIDDDLTVEGAVPAVGPNGELYTSWSGPLGIQFDRSLDGGAIFGTDIHVTDQPGGWAFDIPGISRCNGMPITLCDISNSAHRGTVYIVWSDQRNGVNNTDVFLTKSQDGGNSWSAPFRVNNDNSQRHQFFPWATIDPVSGYLYVVFYDRRDTAGNDTEVWVARSTDGGNSFTNFKVSETPFDPHPSVFFGDYINIAALNGKIYPAWMRLDTYDLSVWVAIIDDSALINRESRNNLISEFKLNQNYPNPFNAVTQISYELPANQNVRITVFDALGQTVQVLMNRKQESGPHTIFFDAEFLPSGVYYYQLKAGTLVAAKKMMLMK